MSKVKWLLGVIGVLLGALFFQRSKAKSAETLLENQETKEDVQKLQATKDKNNASLDLEEHRREDIKKNAEDEKASPTTDTDLLDFINKSDKS